MNSNTRRRQSSTTRSSLLQRFRNWGGNNVVSPEILPQPAALSSRPLFAPPAPTALVLVREGKSNEGQCPPEDRPLTAPLDGRELTLVAETGHKDAINENPLPFYPDPADHAAPAVRFWVGRCPRCRVILAASSVGVTPVAAVAGLSIESLEQSGSVAVLPGCPHLTAREAVAVVATIPDNTAEDVELPEAIRAHLLRIVQEDRPL